MAKVGRPTKYKQSLVKAICLRLMLGESLCSICKRKEYPAKITILQWLQKYPEFTAQYAQAREIQQEILYDEILEIADDSENDYITKDGKNGEYKALDSEHVQRSRLRIDTRKWVMERMAPKKYGNKQQLDHTSTDGSMSPRKTLDDFYGDTESKS